MAKKRTKSQKRKAATRRPSQVNVGFSSDQVNEGATPSYTVSPSAAGKAKASTQVQSSKVSSSTKTEKKPDPLVRTDPRLIKKDMGKALAVSILLLSLLLGIYVLTRYNVVNLPFFT